MSQWTIWEWIAYTMLFIVAIISAADQGIKLAPDINKTMPAFFTSSLWAFAPLVLIIFATVTMVSRELGVIGRKTSTQSDSFAMWPEPYTPIAIIGKTFRNERVILDGFLYTNCEFYNVTFVYNVQQRLNSPITRFSGHLFTQQRTRQWLVPSL